MGVHRKAAMADHPSLRRPASATARRISFKASWLAVDRVAQDLRRPRKINPDNRECLVTCNKEAHLASTSRLAHHRTHSHTHRHNKAAPAA